MWKRQTVAPPLRGRILDVNGNVLVESRELVRLKFRQSHRLD
jgi:hypothetical protein